QRHGRHFQRTAQPDRGSDHCHLAEEGSIMYVAMHRTPQPIAMTVERSSFISALASLTLLVSAELHAQRPTLSAAVRPFIAVDSPVVALTHARVIDGTGLPARDDQ